MKKSQYKILMKSGESYTPIRSGVGATSKYKVLIFETEAEAINWRLRRLGINAQKYTKIVKVS